MWFTERPVSDQRLNLCSRHSDAVGVPELSASKFL
jgi:hypothetical protein